MAKKTKPKEVVWIIQPAHRHAGSLRRQAAEPALAAATFRRSGTKRSHARSSAGFYMVGRANASDPRLLCTSRAAPETGRAGPQLPAQSLAPQAGATVPQPCRTTAEERGH